MTEPADSTPKTADELRADIEATRAELAETADALAAKLDVKAQAKEKVHAVGDKISTGVSTTVTDDKQRTAVVAGSVAAVVTALVVLRARRRRTPKAKLARAMAKADKARRKKAKKRK